MLGEFLREAGLLVAQVQDEKGLRMRRGGTVLAAGGQLEVRLGAGHLEEHAVVAVVIMKSACNSKLE